MAEFFLYLLGFVVFLAIDELITKHGSFDNVIKSLAMELQANSKSNKTIN